MCSSTTSPGCRPTTIPSCSSASGQRMVGVAARGSTMVSAPRATWSRASRWARERLTAAASTNRACCTGSKWICPSRTAGFPKLAFIMEASTPTYGDVFGTVPVATIVAGWELPRVAARRGDSVFVCRGRGQLVQPVGTIGGATGASRRPLGGARRNGVWHVHPGTTR